MGLFSDIIAKASDVGFIVYGSKSNEDKKKSLKQLERQLKIVTQIYKKTGKGSLKSIERLKTRIFAQKNTLTSTSLSTVWCALDLLGINSKAILNPIEFTASLATLSASINTESAATIAFDAIASCAQAKMVFDNLFSDGEKTHATLDMRVVALLASSASSLIKSKEEIPKVAALVKNALFGTSKA